jgi:hypothetical protein
MRICDELKTGVCVCGGGGVGDGAEARGGGSRRGEGGGMSGNDRHSAVRHYDELKTCV